MKVPFPEKETEVQSSRLSQKVPKPGGSLNLFQVYGMQAMATLNRDTVWPLFFVPPVLVFTVLGGMIESHRHVKDPQSFFLLFCFVF